MIMSKHVVRNSIGSLAAIATQAPHLYKMLSEVGAQRRRQRVARVARDAGWLGAGLVVGAGLVAILTPKTGQQIRRRLSDEAQRVREYIKPKLNGVADHTIEGDLS
jgi:galactokinase/mevalonate kinase-like predicted kinase